MLKLTVIRRFYNFVIDPKDNQFQNKLAGREL